MGDTERLLGFVLFHYARMEGNSRQCELLPWGLGWVAAETIHCGLLEIDEMSGLPTSAKVSKLLACYPRAMWRIESLVTRHVGGL
jgi:hypothetical protein